MTPRSLLFHPSVAVCVCEIDPNGLCTEEGVIPVQQLRDALPSELTEHMETLWIIFKHKHTHPHTLAALTVETGSASRPDGLGRTLRPVPCLISVLLWSAGEHDGHLFFKVSAAVTPLPPLFTPAVSLTLKCLLLVLQRAHRPGEEPQWIQPCSPSTGR